MTTLNNLSTILQTGKTNTTEALKIFDALGTVDLDSMIGRWKGSGLHTNHPMDGLLETLNWYGKEFVDRDRVHPLLFTDSNNQIFKVNPLSIGMKFALRFPIPNNEALKPLYNLLLLMLKTEDSQARIRMTEYRGKVSATMIYDHLPISDVFRQVDDNTLLGLMDYKEIEQPFFFILKRDL